MQGRHPRARRTVSVGLAGLMILAACGPARSGGSSNERVAGIYAAVLRWAADTHPGAPGSTAAPGDDGPDARVVYAIGLGGSAVPAALQVVVVKQLRDDVTVRFADERDEALDEGSEGEPVLDHGVLVVLGPVPAEGDEVTVETEVYRTILDRGSYELRVRLTESAWSVAEATPR